MSAFTFVASKAKPANFNEWTFIPDTDRAVLTIQGGLRHDTVLVIDGNDSMEPAWDSMTDDSAQFVYPLMKEDKDGIDVFFAGVKSDEAEDDDSPAGGFLNVSNPLFVREAFQKVKAVGLSSEEAVTEVVSSIFKKYLDHYRAASVEKRATINGLNVILWTDGSFPQGPFEDVLVATAKALEELEAPKDLVGIQLYRVGNVDGVAEKFEYYDNKLKAEKNLDRDLADHCEYTPNGLTQENIAKICTGAVDKTQDEA